MDLERIAAAAVRRVRVFFRRLPRGLQYSWGQRLLSELRRRWVLLSNPHATVRFEGPVYIGPGFHLHIPHRGSFIVGPDVEFRRDFRAEIYGKGKLVIGEGTVITTGVMIGCTTSVELGRRCTIGPYAYISDGSHNYGRNLEKPFMDRGYMSRPVRLEDDSAVATKCTVIASIGERSMVAANTVVNKPIPPFYAAIGVPARLVKYFGPEDAEPEEGKRERLAARSNSGSRTPPRASAPESATSRLIHDFMMGELIDEAFRGNDPLAEGVLDSLALEQLVEYVETTFGVQFEDGDMVAESFLSTAALAALVDEKQGSAKAR